MVKKKVLAIVVAIFLVFSILSANSLGIIAATGLEFGGISDWQINSGTIVQANDGLVFSGTGTGSLIGAYYNNAFRSVDGFHTTINLDSLGSVNNADHDSNFGIFLDAVKSPNHVFDTYTPGLFIYFQPVAENSYINAFNIGALYNLGEGGAVASSSIANNYLEIDKNKGSVDVLLMKSGADWHLFVNGLDRGVDLSAIKPVLDFGRLLFGVSATENKTVSNNYAIRLSEINGVATGTQVDIDTTKFIKSTKANVSANQIVESKEDGAHVSGSLVAGGLNFKYGFNKTFTAFNGFSTTMNTLMDGTNNVNGVVEHFDFGLISVGDGTVNSDRLDVWDYLGSSVTNARGLGIKFIKNAGTFDTLIFVLGANNQFDVPADVVAGQAVAPDANGNITVSFVKTNNGGTSHWTVLSNGRIIVSDNALVNAELDAIGATGACPVYSAGYDNLGNLLTANAEMTVANIGGTAYKKIADTTDTTNTVVGTKAVTDSDFVYSGINPNAQYSITNDGVKVSSMNGPAGFNSMLSYGTKLDTANLGITLKLDTVFASRPNQPHHIDVTLGNMKDANFTDQKCVYIRFSANGNTPQAGLTAQLILNTTGTIAGVIDSGNSMNIPVAADGRVVTKLIKVDGVYRIYLNGIRYPSSSVDAQISTLLDTQLGGKVYLETTSGFDGVIDQVNPTVYYLETVNGLKFVKSSTPGNTDTTDTANKIVGTKAVSDSDFVYSGINPSAQYTITADGVKVSSMNGPSGFNSMLSYMPQLNTASLGVTLKLEEVFKSISGSPHHIDVTLGEKKDANFTVQKCVYIRFSTNGNSPQDGVTAQVILNTTGAIAGVYDTGASLNVPVAADGRVVIKLIKVAGIYRIYLNGLRFPSTTLDAKISDLLDTQFGGKVYLETTSGFDGVTDQEIPTIYYLEAVNGLKFIKATDEIPQTSDSTMPMSFNIIVIFCAIIGGAVLIKKQKIKT